MLVWWISWSYSFLLVVTSRNGLGEHPTETLFVGMEGLAALVGNPADGTRETADAALAHLQIASLFKGCNLNTEVSSCGVGYLTQIDKVGTLETVESDHDLQSQLTVEQRINDWEFEITHRSIV